MKFILRLRLANELGEAFTDLATDQVTAEALIEAGCDSWKTAGPYESRPSYTYVEIFALNYVQTLGNQRDALRKEAASTLELAESLERELMAERSARQDAQDTAYRLNQELTK